MRMIDSTPELHWRLFRITGPLLIRIVPPDLHRAQIRRADKTWCNDLICRLPRGQLDLHRLVIHTNGRPIKLVLCQRYELVER